MAAAAGGLRKLWLAEPHNKYGGGWRLMAAAPMSRQEHVIGILTIDGF